MAADGREFLQQLFAGEVISKKRPLRQVVAKLVA
jgi:hypothetical protein